MALIFHKQPAALVKPVEEASKEVSSTIAPPANIVHEGHPDQLPSIKEEPTKAVKTSLRDRFYQTAPSFLATYDAKVKALQEADKAKQVKEVLAPKKLMSLAEKLAAKKALVEAAKLAEEPQEELSTAIADGDAPVETAAMPDLVQDQKAFASAKDRFLASIHKPQEASQYPTITLQEVESTEAGKILVRDAVIEVLGKNYNLTELAIEIAKLEKTSKILKSKAVVEKLQRFQQAQEDLLTLIDQQEEIVAESVAPSPTTVADAVKECFNGEAPTEGGYQGAFSLNIHLNEKQIAARDLAMSGKSFVLIGAAGTGKTTAQRSVAEGLLESDRLTECSYKLQGGGGMRANGPSFVACAYTRRASANLARAIHKNPRLEQVLRHNIMTIHALLEYEPVRFWDEEKQRESMRFEPQRTALNPLTITHLAIEESSMVGIDLWEKLYDALPEGVQIIFIGDLNQLPPVFGPSILNYALVQLPIIELTHVYRQAGDSLILANAHNILGGKDLVEGPDYEIIRGKSEVQVGQEKMAIALGKMFEIWYDSGNYQPDEDMILSPFNKHALGTDNMNKWIAQFLGSRRQAIVHEIIAGFAKHYLAVGDKVMVNKQDGYIVKITMNAQYHGQEPQIPGSDLTRFGARILGHGAVQDALDDILLGYTDFNLDDLAESMAERKQQASHIVEVLLESGEVCSCSAAGDFNPQIFSLGYVLTVHKAQGCEFRKVFIILHKDHSVMLFRELLYTANTRAREKLALIAKDWVIAKAIKAQRIKGNTLEDKLEYFNSGAVDMLGHIRCTK